MCDFLSGRLIVSHHRNDEAAQALIAGIGEGRVSHVSYIESMAQKLEHLHLPMPEGFEFDLHVLRVPEGEEIWKINYLRSLYQKNIFAVLSEGRMTADMLSIIGSSASHMLVSPDSMLSLCQYGTGVGFQFDPIHTSYKQLLGLQHAGGSTGAGVTVAVLDTGLDPNTSITAAQGSRNFHDDTKGTDIEDINGHGTVVASIIHDVAPDADILVLKVGDRNPITEWNVLAALLATGTADIINMSLAFGMPFRNCPSCGRSQTHSSRSAVFESAICEVLRLRPETIVIAAAGNRQQKSLDFPARFPDVVAVGAIDSQLNRPAYSNYGSNGHTLLFFAPGGGNGEFVGTTHAPSPAKHEGTSFAAPYVSGALALYRGQQGARADRASTLQHFRNTASQNLPGYSVADFGNGLIQM